MLPSILTVVAVLLVMAIVVLAVAWADAVSTSEREWVEHEQARRKWQPPFARGGELLHWVKKLTNELAGKRLSRRPTKTAPQKLAREIHQAAMQAMLPLASPSCREATMACPAEGQGLIGLTPPEVFEVVAYIRQHLSHKEAEQIHDLALHNAMTLADLEQLKLPTAPLTCPLQGDDYVCQVYSARPLRCRPLHADMIAHKFGGGIADGDGQDGPESSYYSVERGVEEGLVEALDEAGLDANVYELNSALVAAMDTPDASERWMRGENIFAGCKVLN